MPNSFIIEGLRKDIMRQEARVIYKQKDVQAAIQSLEILRQALNQGEQEYAIQATELGDTEEY